MKKILAALAALVVAVIGVVSARSEGLITEQAVADLWFGLWYSALALVGSWLLTATVGSKHRLVAICAAAILMIAGGLVRWGITPPVSWLAVIFIVSLASPIAFAAVEAVLLGMNIRLRKGEDGEVVGVKVGDDDTVFIGSPTVPDMKREGVKPDK